MDNSPETALFRGFGTGCMWADIVAPTGYKESGVGIGTSAPERICHHLHSLGNCTVVSETVFALSDPNYE